MMQNLKMARLVIIKMYLKMAKYYDGGVEMVIIPQTNLKKQLDDWGLSIDNITKGDYIGIWHSTEWDGGFDNEERIEEEVERFYFDMQTMIAFLREFVCESGVSKCIIGKFHRHNWFENWSNREGVDIYQDLNMFISQHKLDNNSVEGLEFEIDTNWNLISKIIEGGFRYLSCVSIFFPQIGVIVEPTHNFELIFFSNEISYSKGIIGSLIEQYPELNIYEGEEWDSD